MLDQLLRLPFPSNLLPAPRGNQLAWVVNDCGRRNIWIGDGDAAAWQLTHFAHDDGITLGELCWTPAADAVVFARGVPSGPGLPPNPASAPGGGSPAEIWIAPLATGVPALLGAGHSATVAPSGEQLAYIANGQIWTAQLTGAPNARPLLVDSGACGALSWSPDGERLAFVSERSGYALIGVCHVGMAAVTWIAPSVHHDAVPTWSADGKQIAFVRLEERSTPTYTAHADGPPWSIWLGDPASGAARPIWHAKPGSGSVFTPLPSGGQLLWAAGGMLVFPWEVSGWLHLYALNTATGQAAELTPGQFEVFGMVLADAGEALVYCSNRGQSEARHLWRTDMAMRTTAPLTVGDAAHEHPRVMPDGRMACLRSSARRPAHPVLIARDGRAIALAPAVVPDQLTDPEPVAFLAPDGMPVHAQLFAPRARADGLASPAIVHLHGGPARQMLPAWSMLEAYHMQYALNQYLASQGYAVLSVNYRGGTGYGLAFREPPNFGAGGASEYQDVLGAAHYLRSRADIDPQRIGVYGMSYGGLLTALALARSSTLFAAGVDIAGVSDWRPAFTGTPAPLRETAWASSPLAALDGWTSPVLFIHADDDRVVPFAQTVQIVRALRHKGSVHVEQYILPNEQHDFLCWRSWHAVLHKVAGFFDHQLLARP